jgi:hypothetical protein
MKTCVYFFLFISVLLLSCSSDSNDSEEDEFATLYGTYELTVLQSNDPSTLNNGGETFYNVVDELPCFQVTLTIFEDGTTQTTAIELDIDTESDTGNFVFSCGDQSTSSGTWSGSGNKIKLQSATFIRTGNQLVDARDPETEFFDRVVFTKQ